MDFVLKKMYQSDTIRVNTKISYKIKINFLTININLPFRIRFLFHFFYSSWILRIVGGEQKKKNEEIETEKESLNREADFHPSQDRKRNLHMMYGESSGDTNNTGSVEEKKAKTDSE